jgi:ABC-type nitrate/sulfonate/bicarbonate transport system ATPase subunit
MAQRIDLRRVSLRYVTDERDVLAVDDVSFTVAESEFLCLLGPSGCGKTTIMNLIAGFLAPTKGEVLIGGTRLDDTRHDRGVVFQEFAQLFPWRTARRNVEFGLEMRNVGAPERRRIALEFLRLVGLADFADAYPHQLSGGMQQRVAIARAIAYSPGVLLMDEPFAALDTLTREEMQRLVNDVWHETKKTVVYVTHNVAEAVYLGDRVVVLHPRPGRVKADIPLDLPRPRDPLSTSFVEAQRRILSHLCMH